jgi:hypothetical protein
LNDYMQGDWENIRFGDVYSHTPPGQVPHA